MAERSFHNQPELPFIELESVDSTNNYALGQLHAGLAQDGTGYFAREQVAGKGQRGKTWLAEKDASLILSVVMDPEPLSVMEQFQLSASVAVSACRFLEKYGANDIKIKWPNDLYWQDRKAGGILIENTIGAKPASGATHPSSTSSWRWAVAGIGININQPSFPPELKNPVSLRQITGLEYIPAGLAKELHQKIYTDFRVMINSGFEDTYAAYQSLLYKKGEPVKFRKGNRVFEAIVKNTSADGRLIVQHAISEEFNFGEIEWLIPPAGPEK